MFTNSTENIQNNKKATNTTEEVERYFPGFLSFIDCTEQQQIPRPTDNKRKTIFYSLGKRKGILSSHRLMVNNHGIIIHKTCYKKGCRNNYTFNRFSCIIEAWS